MERHELINKYEKRLQGYNEVEIYQIYREFIRDLTELEQPKVKVPQFVADWIETAKTVYSLSGGMFHGGYVVNKWLDDEDNQRTFALAWFDGYTIEEKWYMVKVKNVSDRYGTLNRNKRSKRFILSSPEENSLYDTKFTRKEIEDAGFGWVFDCPGMEIQEVE